MDFDEKAGVVPIETKWGKWHQTTDEVVLTVINLPAGVRGSNISVKSNTKNIKVVVSGSEVVSGDLFAGVISDETLWTLDPKTHILEITLTKARKGASHCWTSLLDDGSYAADAWSLDETQKKLTLQRMSNENPGFDFSGAEITGNYQGGGPDLPQK